MKHLHTAYLKIEFDDTDEFGHILGKAAKDIIHNANDSGQFDNTEVFKGKGYDCSIMVHGSSEADRAVVERFSGRVINHQDLL